MKWHCSFKTRMKPLFGVVFLFAFAALLAWLTGKKDSNNSNNNPVATEITAAATTTTDDITVVVPANSTTVSFRHE